MQFMHHTDHKMEQKMLQPFTDALTRVAQPNLSRHPDPGRPDPGAERRNRRAWLNISGLRM